MTIPDTRYAKTASGLRIAYQKWGDGPPCLIVPALISRQDGFVISGGPSRATP